MACLKNAAAGGDEAAGDPSNGGSEGGTFVIKLSRLHGAGSIVINADLIETMEACPDTTITLMTKRKFVVEDSLEDVIVKVVEYRGRINAAFVDQQGTVVDMTPVRDSSAA